MFYPGLHKHLHERQAKVDSTYTPQRFREVFALLDAQRDALRHTLSEVRKCINTHAEADQARLTRASAQVLDALEDTASILIVRAYEEDLLIWTDQPTGA